MEPLPFASEMKNQNISMLLVHLLMIFPADCFEQSCIYSTNHSFNLHCNLNRSHLNYLNLKEIIDTIFVLKRSPKLESSTFTCYSLYSTFLIFPGRKRYRSKFTHNFPNYTKCVNALSASDVACLFLLTRFSYAMHMSAYVKKSGRLCVNAKVVCQQSPLSAARQC